MNSKFLLFLLIILVLGGFILWGKTMISEPEEPETIDQAIPVEEIPENRFENVQISYFGKENRFKFESDFEEIVQQTDIELNYKGLNALLKDQGRVVQKLSTPEGWLITDKGMIQLVGPVTMMNEDLELFLNRVDIDLNQGNFVASGSVEITADDYQIQAERMSSDLDLKQIHLSGRPRLTLKKDG